MKAERPHTSKKGAYAFTFHACCTLLVAGMLYPILWMVASSFKETAKVFADAGLIPANPTFLNYVRGWGGFGGISFTVFFTNSVIVSSIATVGALISSAVVAYGFARIRFAGKRMWFAFVILTMMVPYQVIMIPQYILFHWLGWLNTLAPLIVPHFFAMTPFFIFLIIQFFRGIPIEMDEAAILDGCNQYSVFLRISLPLISPAMVTVGIFSFYWRWQDFLSPLLFLSSVRLYTVSLALKLFSDPSANTDWGSIFAMGTLSLVPILIVFFFFQRYLVEGIATSGLKA